MKINGDPGIFQSLTNHRRPPVKAIIPATFVAFASFASMSLYAADHSGHGHHAAAMPHQASAAMQKSDGQVKKIDKAGGKVTLSHGPLLNLNMPAMTMAFKVKDTGWLERMKAGDKIRFVAADVDGVLTVVEFEPAK